MLPGVACCSVATACTRVDPSPRTSPPQRSASSFSVYATPMMACSIRSVAAAGVRLQILLHLREHGVGHVYSCTEVQRSFADQDEIIFLRLGDFLDRLGDLLLETAHQVVVLHAD